MKHLSKTFVTVFPFIYSEKLDVPSRTLHRSTPNQATTTENRLERVIKSSGWIRSDTTHLQKHQLVLRTEE